MQTHANYRVLTICVPLGTCIYHSLYTCICIIMIQTLNIIDRHVRLLLLLCRKLWFLIIPISPSSVANTGPILDSFTQVNTTCSIIKIILLYCIWIVYICWTEFWNHAWSSRGIKILFKSCGKLKKKLNHRRRGLNPRPPDNFMCKSLALYRLSYPGIEPLTTGVGRIRRQMSIVRPASAGMDVTHLVCLCQLPFFLIVYTWFHVLMEISLCNMYIAHYIISSTISITIQNNNKEEQQQEYY